MTTIFAFLHHVAAFALVASLAVEFAQLRMDFTLSTARSLRAADALFGTSAAVVLVVGGLRVFYFEKGADYYLSSPYFLLKFGLFVAVGILSIIPTRAYLSWSSALQSSMVPEVAKDQLPRLRAIVNIEVAGIVLILLCAAAMARGGVV
jgi:putative membrane protein